MSISSASGVIDLVRARVDHSSLSDTVCLEFVNDAKRTMQRRYPLFWQETQATTITLAAATGSFCTFSLPTDTKAIRSVHFIESGTYQTIQHDKDFFGLVADVTGSTAAERPEYWSVYGGTGYLFPNNSTSWDIGVFYEKMLSDYATVTGSDSFITYAPEVLVYETIAEYYDSIAEVDRGQVWHAKAERSMQLLLTQHRAHEERRDGAISHTPGRVRRKRTPRSYWSTWW